MKPVLLFSFFICFFFTFSQETFQWNGKEYFIYPDRVDHSEVGFSRSHSWRYYSDWSYVADGLKIKKSIFNSKKKKINYERHFFKDGIIPVLEPLKDGEYVVFYKKNKPTDREKVAISFTLKNNEPEGPATWLDEKGKIIQKGQYKNGFKEGNWLIYTEKEKLVLEKNYKEGLLHGAFVQYYWNSDLIKDQSKYIESKEDGEKNSFNEAGTLVSKVLFLNGKELVKMRYYENGNLQFKTIFDTVGRNDIQVTYFLSGVVKDSSILNIVSPLGFYYDRYYYSKSVWEKYRLNLTREDSQKSYHFDEKGQLLWVAYFGESSSVYLDSIRNLQGNLEKPFSEIKLNDSTYTLSLVYDGYKGRKKYLRKFYRETDYLNGDVSVETEYEFNKNNDTIIKEFQDFREYDAFICDEDSLILIKSKWFKHSNSFETEYFNFKDSSFFLYTKKYYDNGNLKVFQMEHVHLGKNRQYKQIDKDSLVVYSEDGLSHYWFSDYKLNLSILGSTPNGFYYFRKLDGTTSSTFKVDQNIITVSSSISGRLVPYEFNEFGRFTVVSGNFNNGIQDGEWVFRNEKSKENIIVDYNDGKANITFNKLKYLSERDEVKTVENYNRNEQYKTKKHTRYFTTSFTLIDGDKVGEQNILYRGKQLYEKTLYDKGKRISEIKLTPLGDTISKITWSNGHLASLSKSTSNGLYTQIWTVQDTLYTFTKKAWSATDTVKIYNSAVVGITTCRNIKGETEAIYYFDDKTNCLKSNDSLKFFSKDYSLVNIAGHYYVRLDRFENNRKRYSGFVLIRRNDGYTTTFHTDEIANYTSMPSRFVDTLYTFYENGNIHEIAFRPNENAKKKEQYYKELSLQGNVIGDGYIKSYSFEVDCHKDSKVSLPEFNVHFLNYFNEDGSQTLVNGTGHINRKVNGTPVYEGNYSNEEREGLWKYFDGNGNLTSFGNYVAGERDGLWYSGDLKHIHFVSECVELTDPNYSEIIKNLENDIRIEKTIYKNGEIIFDERFNRN